MTLETRLSAFITAVGTDYKTFRTFMTGSSIGSFSLATTAQDIKGAISELKTAIATVSVPGDATTTARGLGQIATTAQVTAGSDDFSWVTSSKLAARLTAFALPLSYLDTDTALAANSNVKIATQAAVKAYVDALLNAQNAMVFKGVIDASTNPNYPAADAGHLYRISVAGKIGGASGPNVEIGDQLLCLVDSSAAGTHASVGANWNITQANLDGAVIGPASATSGDIALFSGATGKLLSDSGIAPSTDGTFAANSDAKLPTEKAVKTFAAATYASLANTGNLDADLAAAYVAAKT